MTKSKAVTISLTLLTVISMTYGLADSKELNKKPKSPQVKRQTKSEKLETKGLKKGADLFRTSCASCHPAGGNNLAVSKPIKGSWTLATLSTFKSYLEKPVGTMPHYEHIINDEKNLEHLYKYVKALDSASTEKNKSK